MANKNKIRRRTFLEAAGAGAIASALGGALGTSARSAFAAETRALRWGVVGTGGIANRVSPMIQLAGAADLAAISSRMMEKANAFADRHGVENRFDSWEKMIESDSIDAVYVATPTHVREEICVAAANAGKHVLGEKPFANLPSLKRITAACRDNGVGFMDGTHFVHHPRTAQIKAGMQRQIGFAWSLATAFQFNLGNPDNIRVNPEFEPYGAIGDAGWYNMRAAVEYLAADAELVSAEAYARRGGRHNAVVTATGVIRLSDGSASTWTCGFESGALNMDLRISGKYGVIKLDDFVLDLSNPASYEHRRGGTSERFEVEAPTPAAAQMFDDFAAMVDDTDAFEASVRASERTQEWLDAIWNSAIANDTS